MFLQEFTNISFNDLLNAIKRSTHFFKQGNKTVFKTLTALFPGFLFLTFLLNFGYSL